MNFSWVLKAYPQKGVDGDSQAEHYGLGRWPGLGKKRIQQSSRRRRRNYQKEQAQEGKAVGRSQPATSWAGAAQRTGARGPPEAVGGRKCVCLQRRVLADWFQKEQSSSATRIVRPQTRGLPSWGQSSLHQEEDAGGKQRLKMALRNQTPGTATARVAARKPNPGTTEALQEVMWGEAGGILPLGLGCSRNSPSPRSITHQALCCTLNIPSPV